MSVLRDRNVPTASFRHASDHIARLLCAYTIAVLRHEEATAANTTSDSVMIIPVMRAGMALVPAFTEMMPNAPVGIVGIERDEQTARPALYYDKLPKVLPEKAVVLDPMLATGGTACLVAEMLIGYGYAKYDIHFSGVLAAPEGMNRLSEIIPRSHIVVAAIDQGLDAQNFIVPGLGDYGDRYYGT